MFRPVQLKKALIIFHQSLRTVRQLVERKTSVTLRSPGSRVEEGHQTLFHVKEKAW